MNRNVLSPLQINQRRQLAEQIAALTDRRTPQPSGNDFA